MPVQRRLPASEAVPVECGWGTVQSRIVEHRGQGSTHMRGNVRTRRPGLVPLLVLFALSVLTMDAI